MRSSASPSSARLFWGALLLTAAFASPLGAQWSADAGNNLAIGDKTGEQVQVKLRATPDGGCYISWFDNSAGGYDVYLQRLNAGGVEQFAHNGVLIADRGFSSTQDYDLDVDAAGNAFLTFRDDRGAGTQITATKVDSSGTQLWGATGVQLTSTTAFVASPKITATADGNAVVAWTQDADTVGQKLDGSGSALWGAGVTVSPGVGSYSASDLHAGESGTAVLSFVHQTGGFGSPRNIFAQKFSTTGALLWGAGHVAVFDGGSLQFGNFPTFVPDGSGGGVFSWYSSSPLQCYVQRIEADGTESFAHDGVTVSTNGAQIRVSPHAGFNPATEEIVVFWTEENSGQSMFGVYGQKIDASGARLWGSSGKVLAAVGTTVTNGVRTLSYGTGAMTFWVASTAFGMDQVIGCRVDTDGDFVVAPLAAASTLSNKSRLDVALSTEGFAMLGWQDTQNDSGDILAQSFLSDGTLGVSSCVPAAAGARQGGSNPDVYAVTNPPLLGDCFLASVDAVGAGQTTSVLFGFDTPLTLTLGGGQVLLAIDLGGSGELFTGAGLSPSSTLGGVDFYSAAAPLNTAFCGLNIYSQAILFGSPPFQLSNAQDLVVGN